VSATATGTKCERMLLAEGRICDQPAVGIYVGLDLAPQPFCQAHADQLRRTWGVRVRPLPEHVEAKR